MTIKNMNVINSSNNLLDALEKSIKSEEILDTVAIKFVHDNNPLLNASLTQNS